MRRKKGFLAWLNKKPKPLLFVVVSDILIAAIALVVFSLFHHVIPREAKGLGEISARPSANIAAVEATVPAAEPSVIPVETIAATIAPVIDDPTVEPDSTPEPVGYFGSKFADKFISGDAQTTNDGTTVRYTSENVSITGTSTRDSNSNCHIADIYVKDISNISTALAEGKYGSGLRGWVNDIAALNNAIIAINGDYYGARKSGAVIRNGTLYRDAYSDMDVCVLYWDGVMETYSPYDFDADAAMARGAYQAWCFGPLLLNENGQPLDSFNTSVAPKNPRTAIGYYEPGHYCFVVVDGRSSKSDGMTMKELAAFMSSLGCVSAYNMDGGQTSVMTWGGDVISKPSDGGRKTSDIIMISE